jgi:hypothetical protein
VAGRAHRKEKDEWNKQSRHDVPPRVEFSRTQIV